MKKISKVLMLLVVVILGGLVLASCSYKGKSYKYDSYKLSDSLKSYASLLGEDNFDELFSGITESMGTLTFSKDGKQVTMVPKEDPEDEDPGYNLDVSYPVIVISKKVYIDMDLDGVISDTEANQYFQVKGSKLIMHLSLDSYFSGLSLLGTKVEGFWVEVTFKRA
jgi:hypothetical protein